MLIVKPLVDDCNVDFSRVNAYTIELMKLFYCNNITPCITSLNHDISFTRWQEINFSCIDHFAVSNYLATNVTYVKYALVDDMSISEINLPDRSPLLLSVNFAVFLFDLDIKSSKVLGL